MYLHEDREQFADAVRKSVQHTNMSEISLSQGEKKKLKYMLVDIAEESSFVLLETSFTAVSFPTVMMTVTNYIGGVMEEEAPEMIGEYHIEPFEMKVQGLDRKLADKVFDILNN